MENKEQKLILVVYVGFNENTPPYDVANIINKIKENFNDKIEKENLNAFFIFLPKYGETSNCTIECINPVLLTEELYNKELEKINKIKTEFEKVINKLENE